MHLWLSGPPPLSFAVGRDELCINMEPIFFLIRLAVFPFRFCLYSLFWVPFFCLGALWGVVSIPFAFFGAAMRNDSKYLEEHFKTYFNLDDFLSIYRDMFRWLTKGGQW